MYLMKKKMAYQTNAPPFCIPNNHRDVIILCVNYYVD